MGAIQQISLPPKPTSNPNWLDHKEVVGSGWGLIFPNININPKELNEVTVKVWAPQACQKKYPGYKIDDGMLCAASPNKDTCQGDSGGPLTFTPAGQGKPVLVGITSWGIGCATQQPGVYTKVTHYLDWIAKQTGNVNTIR